MALTREQILALQDLDVEEFDVPEWNDTVYLRNWTGRERDKFEQEFTGDRANGKFHNIRASVAALTLSDDSGKRLFTEADIITLGGKSGAALDRIFTRACQKNHLLAPDIEKLEGNSEGGQKGHSGSA